MFSLNHIIHNHQSGWFQCSCWWWIQYLSSFCSMWYPEFNEISFLSWLLLSTYILCDSHDNQKHQTPVSYSLFIVLMLSVLSDTQTPTFFFNHISTSTSLMPRPSFSNSSLFWLYFCCSQGVFYGPWSVPSTMLHTCLCCILPAKLQPWVHANDFLGLREFE